MCSVAISDVGVSLQEGRYGRVRVEGYPKPRYLGGALWFMGGQSCLDIKHLHRWKQLKVRKFLINESSMHSTLFNTSRASIPKYGCKTPMSSKVGGRPIKSFIYQYLNLFICDKKCIDLMR